MCLRRGVVCTIMLTFSFYCFVSKDIGYEIFNISRWVRKYLVSVENYVFNVKYLYLTKVKTK